MVADTVTARMIKAMNRILQNKGCGTVGSAEGSQPMNDKVQQPQVKDTLVTEGDTDRIPDPEITATTDSTQEMLSVLTEIEKDHIQKLPSHDLTHDTSLGLLGNIS